MGLSPRMANCGSDIWGRRRPNTFGLLWSHLHWPFSTKFSSHGPSVKPLCAAELSGKAYSWTLPGLATTFALWKRSVAHLSHKGHGAPWSLPNHRWIWPSRKLSLVPCVSDTVIWPPKHQCYVLSTGYLSLGQVPRGSLLMLLSWNRKNSGLWDLFWCSSWTVTLYQG